MQLAAISTFILVYCLVQLLFWRKASQTDHMEARLNAVAKLGMDNTAETSELSLPFTERFLKPAIQAFVKWLASLMSKTENPRMAAELRLAGINTRPNEYYASRLIVMLLGAVFGFAFGLVIRIGILYSLISMVIGFVAVIILMRFSLKSRIKKRKLAVQNQLPEVLDLLSVSVEAGLGFDAALQRISERASGPLIDEMNAAYREITLGRPRAEALRNLEQRCGLEEIKTFVAAIIQADQLGISLKNVLKSQAQQMRLLKRQKIEEKAMKAPVKIIMPLVFFVFPVLFIILLGPAVLSIIGMQGVFG